MLIAAATEPQRGWGGPVALAAACLIFWLFTLAYAKIKNPSPPPPTGATPKPITAGQRKPRPIAAKPEPRVDPDPDLHETKFPSRQATDDNPWYGRIIEVGGRRFRAAAHIARTGESPPPERERDDLDDALDLVDESEERP
jgi:hypothetical protein